MLRIFRIIGMVGILFILLGSMPISAEVEVLERTPRNIEQHNWKQSSVDYSVIDAGTHEYNYWKNFMKKTRTCQIYHRIKTVVYYCDIHNHTKSETTLEKIIHSERHRDD